MSVSKFIFVFVVIFANLADRAGKFEYLILSDCFNIVDNSQQINAGELCRLERNL